MLYSQNGGRKLCLVCEFAQARLSLNNDIIPSIFTCYIWCSNHNIFFYPKTGPKLPWVLHLLRLDHESFALTKTHITHSISAHVSFIYRMAIESSGFLTSNSQHWDSRVSCRPLMHVWLYIPSMLCLHTFLMGTNVSNQWFAYIMNLASLLNHISVGPSL